MLIERSKYEAIPAGVYPAIIKDIVAENGIYGEQLKFNFHLDPFEGYDSGKDLHAWASARFNPKTKLYKWAKAAIGDVVKDAEALDVDALKGRRILVLISHTEKDGTAYEHIDEVLPVARPKTVDQVNAEMESIEVVTPY